MAPTSSVTSNTSSLAMEIFSLDLQYMLHPSDNSGALIKHVILKGYNCSGWTTEFWNSLQAEKNRFHQRHHSKAFTNRS